MSMSPYSGFMRFIGNLMIIPQSEGFGQIILNATDPESHVYRGEIAYTRSVYNDEDLWTFEARFSAADVVSDTVHVELNPFAETSHIPREVYDRIHRFLETRGTFPYHRLFVLADSSEFEQLPVLILSIRKIDGNLFNLAIPPSDYLVPRSEPNERNEYRLMLEADYRVGRKSKLGRNFVDKVALYLDSRDRLIGFGEPQEELL